MRPQRIHWKTGASPSCFVLLKETPIYSGCMEKGLPFFAIQMNGMNMPLILRSTQVQGRSSLLPLTWSKRHAALAFRCLTMQANAINILNGQNEKGKKD